MAMTNRWASDRLLVRTGDGFAFRDRRSWTSPRLRGARTGAIMFTSLDNATRSWDVGQRAADDEEPFLEIAGVADSTLRATPTGLLITNNVVRRGDGRRWPYAALSAIRIDAYGAIAVIRGTVRATGADLPLLLLEPDQVSPARRGLEIVWNLMSSTSLREAHE
jgi:hypothetical protein